MAIIHQLLYGSFITIENLTLHKIPLKCVASNNNKSSVLVSQNKGIHHYIYTINTVCRHGKFVLIKYESHLGV